MTRFTLLALALAGCPAVPSDDPVTKDDDRDTGPTGLPDTDNDGFDTETDCDDNDPAVNPGAAETCNEVDDDCDGEVDNSPVDGGVWYADADGDSYGDASARRTGCEQPSGYVADSTDCNDASALYHPNAEESACTAADPDYNCNGQPDEGDLDGDGAMSCDDCDDTEASTHPGAEELCDGIDNDCNGSIDDGGGGTSNFYADADADGYGDPFSFTTACAAPEGYVENDDDCDDLDPDVSPAGREACNGYDDDCDGRTDESDAIDVVTWYRDSDGDGYGDAGSTTTACDAPAGYGADSSDCNDASASIYPGAPEYCGGTDYDCDGTGNESTSVDVMPYYDDADGDGYEGTVAGYACTAPAGTSFTASDCDDADTAISPAASDDCDSIDNDCDGDIDGGLTVPGDYASIQDAIDAAASGDSVCIDAGYYYETIDFSGKNITVQGAGGYDTVIDGSGTGPVVRIDNGERTATLRGVGITGGTASSGAGLYVYGTSPTLDDLYIYNNACVSTTCYGTGAYVYSGSPTMTDVTISYNYAYNAATTYAYAYGTGLYMYGSSATVDGLSLEYNYADVSNATSYGIAIGTGLYLSSSYADFTDTDFTYNYAYFYTSTSGRYAYSYGAGMYLASGASSFDGLTMSNNGAYFYSNTPQVYGAGIYLNNDDSTFDHAHLYENFASAYVGYGIAVYATQYAEPTFTNCIIASNQLYDWGYFSYTYAYGTIGTDYYANPSFVNCDVVGNNLDGYAAYGGGAYMGYYGDVTFQNTSVAKNTLAARYNYGGAVYLGSTSSAGTLTSTYSNFYGNTSTEFSNISTPVGSSGNIAVNPGYTDTSSSYASAWDLTLSSSSSMVNAGDPALSDVDGSRSDIGAYGGPGGGW